MKLFGYILAFLVLALSALPCTDGLSSAVKPTATTISANASHGQPEPYAHEDTCSPFCQCSCCAVFTTITNFTAALPPALRHSPAFSSYIPRPIHHIALPVWQPPQLT